MVSKLTISCSKENLSKVRHFVEKILHKNSVDELETHKLVLAVDEVCANLIIHSNRCDTSQHIEVQIDISPGKQVIFLIKDQGIYFDFTRYQEPNLEEVVSSKRKGGVGLMLVKRIMDKIEFYSEKNFNICRLTKKFN